MSKHSNCIWHLVDILLFCKVAKTNLPVNTGKAWAEIVAGFGCGMGLS